MADITVVEYLELPNSRAVRCFNEIRCFVSKVLVFWEGITIETINNVYDASLKGDCFLDIFLGIVSPHGSKRDELCMITQVTSPPLGHSASSHGSKMGIHCGK